MSTLQPATDLTANLVGTAVILISEGVKLWIRPCDGRRTFADPKAWMALPNELDYELREMNTDRRGKPTPRTQVAVYEIVQDILVSQLVKLVQHLSKDVWFQEDQVIEFYDKQSRDWMEKPHGEISRTYFFYKAGEELKGLHIMTGESENALGGTTTAPDVRTVKWEPREKDHHILGRARSRVVIPIGIE